MSRSTYRGRSLHVTPLGSGLVELCFDRENEAINKLDNRTVAELLEATSLIASDAAVKGVLLTSSKDVFIVGADITEFAAMFALPEAELIAHNTQSNRAFTAIELLPVPTVVAINGAALGGGLETALAADFRVMSTQAQVGLPEVKLGLFPGFGGTVRLPRVAGLQTALDWITGGAAQKADGALQAQVVDEVAEPGELRDRALALLKRAIAGEADWQSRRTVKASPLQSEQASELFAAVKAKLAKGPKHQPAALAAVALLENSISQPRDQALALEATAFATIAKTQAAASLVQIFLNDQALKKKFKAQARNARPLKQAAVLGAGIMGGGIAYTSALRGTPVLLKDIQQPQLDLGIDEAQKLLAKQVKGGRLTQEKAAALLTSIHPQLDYAGFAAVDVVVEAVVENIKIKHLVLAEVEAQVGSDAVIASNTSSLRIDDLARPLARPENFAGMHFFNPVPSMPLVEVIKGERSSDAAVAAVVGFALAMGKTPIVVKDGPGFLVNRIITPYMQAFGKLVVDGADFARVDAVMEAFGWPMGPAYLNDVIGMDTGLHVAEIISTAFPERMARTWKDPLEVMVANRRLGQKNGLGFYRYETDPSGRPRKHATSETYELLAGVQANGRREFEDTEIVERMMLPLLFEAARCLEEGIVGSAAELDMALLLGIGLPQYLGGALKYADWLGADRLLELSDRYRNLGPQYDAPHSVRTLAAQGRRYYQER